MIRRLVPLAVAALAGTVLSAPPAIAADLPAPTLNLTDGQTVSQLVALTAGDLHGDAVAVRVAFGTLPVAVLPVAENTAAGTLETWGLTGSVPLEVSQCLDAEGLDCGAAATLSLSVDNPEATYTPSREGTQRTHDFDMTIGLDVTSGSPQLAVGVDDGSTSLVVPGHLLTVDVDGLAEGPHDVRAAVCSSDGTPCTAPTTHAFEVVRTVAAGFSVAPPVFSPNGDGHTDATTFSYALDDPWESGTIQVRQVGIGNPLRTWNVVAPGGPGGDDSIGFDGTDQEGAALAAGDYTATLTANRTLDGQEISSSYVMPFTIDLEALPPTGLSLTRSLFHPQQDGYRDTTRLSWTAGESYEQVDLEVRNAADQPVRLLTGVQRGPTVWDGRDDAGDLVPAGAYMIRLRARDQVGNEAWSAPVPVRVSGKVLATRTRSVTVTPQESIVSKTVGACSRRTSPSKHGWPGSASHLSNVRCEGSYDESLAWSVHRTELPPAVKYRKVQLGWYGGPTVASSLEVATTTLYDLDDRSVFVDWFSSVNYLAQQHLPFAPAAEVVEDGRVKWPFATSGGNRYDVKRFTITYRADVLVNPS